MKHHPKLSLRSADALSCVRADAVTKENMVHSFTIPQILVDNNLLNKPAYIYNMDETGIPLDYKQRKRIAAKGVCKVHRISSGNKTQITVVACGNTVDKCYLLWINEG